MTVMICLVLISGVQESATPAALYITQGISPQSPISADVGQQVYKQLPFLPLENRYVSKQTRQVNSENNLVNRLIQYHVRVKGRPPNYRLDWKLTLADYLGANELLEETLYPGYETLQQSPMPGDRAAIKRLNREQRDALVQTLVKIFDPKYPTTAVPASNTSP